jgi:hypothetical protein
MNELKMFLEEHPHLIPYQIRLEREMNLVPDADRLKVLAKHIIYNLQELEIEFKLLQLKLTVIGDINEGNT